MISAPKCFAGLAAAALATSALAACSSSSTSSSSTSSSSKPVSGGTLHIVSASGPDHIDTVPAYYTVDYQLERAYARQLVSYPTVPASSTSSAGWTTISTRLLFARPSGFAFVAIGRVDPIPWALIRSPAIPRETR